MLRSAFTCDLVAFQTGSEVALTAVAAAGFQFAGWGGDVSSAVNPLTIQIDDDLVVTATFVGSGPTMTPVRTPTPVATPSGGTTPGGLSTPTATPTPAASSKSKCDAGKMLCVAKKQACLLTVHAKAEKKGVAIGGAAVLKCGDAFDGGAKGFGKGCIGKLEQKEDLRKPETICSVTGDLAALASRIDAFVDGMVRTVDPGFPAVQPPNGCNAGEKACIGRYASCLLHAQLSAVKKGAPVSGAATQGCQAQFDGGGKPEKGCIRKLELKRDPAKPKTLCSVAHTDVASLRAAIESFVDDVVGAIRSSK